MILEEIQSELEKRIKEIEAAIVVTKEAKHDTLAAVEYLRGVASAYRSCLMELKKVK